MNKNNLVDGLKVLLFGPIFALIASAWIRIIGVDLYAHGKNMDDSIEFFVVVGIFGCGLIACILSIFSINCVVGIIRSIKKEN